MPTSNKSRVFFYNLANVGSFWRQHSIFNGHLYFDSIFKLIFVMFLWETCIWELRFDGRLFVWFRFTRASVELTKVFYHHDCWRSVTTYLSWIWNHRFKPANFYQSKENLIFFPQIVLFIFTIICSFARSIIFTTQLGFIILFIISANESSFYLLYALENTK